MGGDQYSVPAEAQRLLEEGILRNLLMPDLVGPTFYQA